MRNFFMGVMGMGAGWGRKKGESGRHGATASSERAARSDSLLSFVENAGFAQHTCE
jgi:hypothetical protein